MESGQWAARSHGDESLPVPGGPSHGDAAESDTALVEALRGGDRSAAATLFARHHDSALRAARAIAGPAVAEDLVSEAFAKILAVVLNGGGPNEALRPYLVTTIRHLYVDGLRRSSREFPVEDPDVLRVTLSRAPVADEEALTEVLGEAMALLPPRWREILWRSVVLGEPLAVVAAKMGLNPNSAAALNFRARAGLRKAYLDLQVAAETAATATGAASGAAAEAAAGSSDAGASLAR